MNLIHCFSFWIKLKIILKKCKCILMLSDKSLYQVSQWEYFNITDILIDGQSETEYVLLNVFYILYCTCYSWKKLTWESTGLCPRMIYWESLRGLLRLPFMIFWYMDHERIDPNIKTWLTLKSKHFWSETMFPHSSKYLIGSTDKFSIQQIFIKHLLLYSTQ